MPVRSQLWIVLLSFMISISVHAAAAQRGRAEALGIRGKLMAAGNREADDHIEVRLEKESMQIMQTAYTDSSGSFEFRNLASGTYFIAVNLDGYEPVHQQVEVMSGFGNTTITVFLTKSSNDSAHAEGLDAEDPDIIDVTQMKENLPKKAVQDYEKALVERKKGKLESAIKLLEDAVRLAPNFFNAHNSLGALYQSLKRYMDAEKEFKRSSELSAKSERPLVNLGSLYIEEAESQKDNPKLTGQMLDKAMDNLEAAVKMNPRSANGYYLLGLANYKSSFLEEAEAAFKKAHDLNPKLSRINLLLANIHWRQAKWPEVVENIDAYLKENPKAPDRAAVEDLRAKVVKEHSE